MPLEVIFYYIMQRDSENF